MYSTWADLSRSTLMKLIYALDELCARESKSIPVPSRLNGCAIQGGLGLGGLKLLHMKNESMRN